MRFPLLSLEYGGCQLHALAAILDSGSQKQSTQVLFHGPGTDIQLLRDFLIAAAFDQKLQNLFIASRYFDVAEIQHSFLSACSKPSGFCFDLNSHTRHG
jgi:hypothetical protein